jgi:predicted transglutaminase-like cysteine proteinase
VILRCFVTKVFACAALIAVLVGPTHARTLANLGQELLGYGDGLFGSTEVSSHSFRTLPQWDRVISRVNTKERTSRPINELNRCKDLDSGSWCSLIKRAAPLERMSQLVLVNRFFNRMPYRADQEAYGMREYWATPREFMIRSGDCEDYSIAKYFALRELGFSEDKMRIVVLKDKFRGTGHAVVAVYVDSDILILDSMSNSIFSHTRYKYYIPQYSMNETKHWVHIQRND